MMEKLPMRYARNGAIALGLAALSASAAVPAFAAAPLSNAATLRMAAPDNVMQIHERSRRNGRSVTRAYGYQFPSANIYGGPYGGPSRPYVGAYGAANGYAYGGSANGYDCLGGRDSDGVPCGIGY
jgi:hypothetical protein